MSLIYYVLWLGSGLCGLFKPACISVPDYDGAHCRDQPGTSWVEGVGLEPR